MIIAKNSAHFDFGWNQVSTSVAVQKNTGGGSVTHNTVGTSLTCTANNPAFLAASNSVSGTNTCGG